MIGRRFAFTVPFVAGKQRHRLDRRHARMYTPNETIRNEAAIRDAALGAMREAYPELEGLLFPFRVPSQCVSTCTIRCPNRGRSW